MITKKLFLYAFIASIFFGDILVFRKYWTYGFQGIYHLMLIIFLVLIVTVKIKIPDENLAYLIRSAIYFLYLLIIILLNSLQYYDQTEYYKRNISFLFLMFLSISPLVVINRSILNPTNINYVYFAGGIAASLTGLFIIILRITEVNDLASAFRYQLDTIPVSWHLKMQKLTSDISERKILFMNLKHLLYNQIGIRMVWGFIFISSFQSSHAILIFMKKAIQLFLLFLVLLSGSRESCLMLLLFIFIKSKIRQKIILVFTVSLILFTAYHNLSGLYFSELINEVPILNRFNILFEFLTTIKNTRIDLWLDTIELFKINPLMGIGPNGFVLYSNGIINYIIYNADNSILGFATAFGIIGLLLIVKFIYVPVKYISRNIKLLDDHAVKIMYSGCIAYLITSFFAPHFMWPYNNLDAIFWLSVSLILLQINSRNSVNEESYAV